MAVPVALALTRSARDAASLVLAGPTVAAPLAQRRRGARHTVPRRCRADHCDAVRRGAPSLSAAVDDGSLAPSRSASSESGIASVVYVVVSFFCVLACFPSSQVVERRSYASFGRIALNASIGVEHSSFTMMIE